MKEKIIFYITTDTNYYNRYPTGRQWVEWRNRRRAKVRWCSFLIFYSMCIIDTFAWKVVGGATGALKIITRWLQKAMTKYRKYLKNDWLGDYASAYKINKLSGWNDWLGRSQVLHKYFRNYCLRAHNFVFQQNKNITFTSSSKFSYSDRFRNPFPIPI